jgi:cell division transport system ATP-binding protein
MIELENISLRYEDGPPILQDVSLHIEPGSFHFLTGKSGAGKTSLLKLIFLALRPSRGKLSMFGKDIASLSRTELPEIRRQIGVIFQDFRLLNHLSVYENVTLPLRIAGQKELDYRKNAVELLSWVGLGDRLMSLPETLSGGEKQRAAIARAVIARPRLIIADEPTGNVDWEIGFRLLRLMEELNKMGTTVILATHDKKIWEQIDHPRLHIADSNLERITS